MQIAAHGLTLSIKPTRDKQTPGAVRQFLDRMMRFADDLGVTILSARTAMDGAGEMVVAITEPHRGAVLPLTPAEPLKLLAQILYHPLDRAVRPAGLDAEKECTLATLIWRAGLSGRPLPSSLHPAGIMSQPGDALALSLCPALLHRAGLLPAGVTIHAALTRLSFLLGAGHGRLQMGSQTMDTVLVPGQLVRALVSTDGTLPPSTAATALAA